MMAEEIIIGERIEEEPELEEEAGEEEEDYAQEPDSRNPSQVD